ncbi:PIN domain-containing protein [Thermococcus sp.]
MFVDSSVILNVMFETQLTELARKVIESNEPKITSDTVIDEVYLIVLKKVLLPESRSTRGLKRLLRKDPKAREKAGELLALVLGSIHAMDIVVVGDAKWDAVGELVSEYGLLPHDATAIEYGCERLATLDDDFKVVKDVVELVPGKD